jgi:hypothetical protein
VGRAQPMGTGRRTPARQWLDDTGTLWSPHRRNPWTAPATPSSHAPRPCAGSSMSCSTPRTTCWRWWPAPRRSAAGGGSGWGSSASGWVQPCWRNNPHHRRLSQSSPGRNAIPDAGTRHVGKTPPARLLLGPFGTKKTEFCRGRFRGNGAAERKSPRKAPPLAPEAGQIEWCC